MPAGSLAMCARTRGRRGRRRQCRNLRAPRRAPCARRAGRVRRMARFRRRGTGRASAITRRWRSATSLRPPRPFPRPPSARRLPHGRPSRGGRRIRCVCGPSRRRRPTRARVALFPPSRGSIRVRSFLRWSDGRRAPSHALRLRFRARPVGPHRRLSRPSEVS